MPQVELLKLSAVTAIQDDLTAAVAADRAAIETVGEDAATSRDAAAVSATASAASAAAAQAVEFAQQDYLISAGALHTTVLSVPSLADLTLDFGRRAFGRSEAGAVSEVGVPADFLTATRASTATYVDATGTIQTAAANEARTGHHIWRDAAWRRRLLVEPQSTNILLHSANLTNAIWLLAQSDFAITPAASVIAGQVSHRLANLGLSASRGVVQEVGTLTGGKETVSILIEQDTAAAFRLGLWDQTLGAFVCRIQVTFATVSAVITDGAGEHSVLDLGIGPNGGRLLRVSLTATGTAGNQRRIIVYPSGIPINTNASIIHHVQHEERASATSVIVTGAAQVTRAMDVMRIDAGTWAYSSGGFSVAMKAEVTFGDSSFTGEGRAYQATESISPLSRIDLEVRATNPSTGWLSSSVFLGGVSEKFVNTSSTHLSLGMERPFSTATRYSADDIAMAVDGVLYGPSFAPGLPDLSAAPLILGSGGVFSIEQLRIWATPLTDTQLTEASA